MASEIFDGNDLFVLLYCNFSPSGVDGYTRSIEYSQCSVPALSLQSNAMPTARHRDLLLMCID